MVTTRYVPPGLSGYVVPINELPSDEAVALFLARVEAGGLRPGRAGRGRSAICVAVGNQPLAIELLAAHACRAPLTRLRERVGRGLDVLKQGDPTRPERQRGMRPCFELSFQALGEGVETSSCG